MLAQSVATSCDRTQLHVVGSRPATDRVSRDGHNFIGAQQRAGGLPPQALVVCWLRGVAPLSAARKSWIEPIKNSLIVLFTTFSQNRQIEAFEAVANCRSCIRLEWERCSRVLQTQRQNQLKQVNKKVTDTLARSPLGRVQPHKIGHFGQTRIVVALLVALPWSACFSFSDYHKEKAHCLSVGSVF